ncbi:ZPP protein, partial [Polypterus senegalus]
MLNELNLQLQGKKRTNMVNMISSVNAFKRKMQHLSSKLQCLDLGNIQNLTLELETQWKACVQLDSIRYTEHFENLLSDFDRRFQDSALLEPITTFKFYPFGEDVDFRYKESFRASCHREFFWGCFNGNCGYTRDFNYGQIDSSPVGDSWCQSEGYMSRILFSDKPFDLRVPQNCPTTYKLMAHDPDGDYVKCRYGHSYNYECYTCAQHSGFTINENSCELTYYGGQGGLFMFELVMEDFSKWYIRLQYNDGSSSYKMPLSSMRVRRATTNSTSSSNSSYPSLSNVTSTVSYSWWNVISSTTLQPRTSIPNIYQQNISTSSSTAAPNNWWPWWNGQSSTVTPTTTNSWWPWLNGGYSTNTPTTTQSAGSGPTDSLSRIPIQFILEVSTPVPSCTFGEYRPRFLYPTPEHGEMKKASVGNDFQFGVKAQASYASIYSIIVSGPLNISKVFQYDYRTGIGEAVVKWRPSENDLGEVVPICFFAETQEGYQSEMRCITVTVGRPTHPQISIDASVVCTQTTMTLFVLKSSVRGLNEHYVRLNDPTCLVTSNSSHLIASVSLNSCGTQLQENSTDLIFRNEITSFDHPHEVITRKNQVEIPFSCSFPKTGHVSSSFIAHKANYMFSEAGFGTFTYIFEFYESSEFTRIINPSQYPIEVELEQMLYMEIDVQSSIANTKLFVESCRATPHDDPYDPVYYDIISNGCVQDDTTIVYSNNQTEFRFGVAAFNFIGDYSQVYISCTVILCTSGNPGTRCAQGCMNNGSSTVYFRRRRALSLESQEHFISQGPLYLTKRAQYNNDSREMLSQNILVIVAALVVAVILISGVVIYRGKLSEVVQYSRLPSAEC